MTGSEFLATYARRGLPAWEAAVLDLARQNALCPWGLFELPLQDAKGNSAVLTIASDVLAVGTLEDHLRMPLLPGTAQSVLNLRGQLLPTPWLVYNMYRAAPLKLEPVSFWPNKGPDLAQYAAHSAAVDAQKGASRLPASGTGKNIVVSNIYRPGTVLIQGMYRPPPAPDVFDDHRALTVPDRQPIQPASYAHGDFYVDYSHIAQAVEPICVVNGQEMLTEELYRHPTLSALVSNEGPLKFVRYPSRIPVPPPGMLQKGQGLAVVFAPDWLDRGLAWAAESTRKFPFWLQDKIHEQIADLANYPALKHPIKPLKGRWAGVHSQRAGKDHRILFVIGPTIIEVILVDDRKDAYEGDPPPIPTARDAIPRRGVRERRPRGRVYGLEPLEAQIARSARLARRSAGISQVELARRIKRSQTMVSAVESGRVSPNQRYVFDLLRACGLPRDWVAK